MITAKKLHKRDSFTLMELLVVVIILTILAAFVIPNYRMSMEKAYERNAIISLRAMAAANKIYLTQNAGFWPNNFPVFNDITQINTNLELSVTPNSVEYFCVGTGAAYSCIAYYPDQAGNQWSIAINSGTLDAKPYCNTTPCPTCPDALGGGC